MNDVPAIAGGLEGSLNQFEHRALECLRAETEKAAPDNALVAVLCDAVRIKREYVDFAENRRSSRNGN